jgi:hypothetical protein
MSRPYSTHGLNTDACMDLVGKTERKRPPGRHRRRWEDSIKIDLIKK